MRKMPIPTAPQAETRCTIRERIYQTLLNWIVDGTLQPGEKILDTEIAKYFATSRTPVREALQLLADQRLVEITPGRASRVTEIDSNQARSNYELMGHLNALALDLLHVQITDAFIEELCNSNRAMAAAIAQKDYPAIRAADRAFHFAFVQLVDNPFLTDFFTNLYAHCLRIENLYFSEKNDFSESICQHEMIVKALSDADLDAAKQGLIKNWVHTIQNIESLPPQHTYPQ